MDKELTKKIKWVKEKLRGQEVQDLALFDVKEGQDGEKEASYYETYLKQTREDMAKKSLFSQMESEWEDLAPWEKLCCYKISVNKGVDCDAALRSTVIYQVAFGGGEIVRKGKTCLLKRDGFILRGDTMNSYATTVHEYLHSVLGNDQKLFDDMKDKQIVEKRDKGRLYAHDKYYRPRERPKRHWERAILHRYDDFFAEKIPPAAEEFFRLYHTVGNFIPWPDGCNVPRGRGATRDYWDWCLKDIYKWYQDNPDCTKRHTANHDALKKLVGSRKVILGKWLATFTSWNDFVEKNYIQDFVNQSAGGGYGEPKELWEGHFTKGVMPKEKTDFEQFFTNASAWITARGVRIALAVKEALAAEKSAAAREARP